MDMNGYNTALETMNGYNTALETNNMAGVTWYGIYCTDNQDGLEILVSFQFRGHVVETSKSWNKQTNQLLLL